MEAKPIQRDEREEIEEPDETVIVGAFDDHLPMGVEQGEYQGCSGGGSPTDDNCHRRPWDPFC